MMHQKVMIQMKLYYTQQEQGQPNTQTEFVSMLS